MTPPKDDLEAVRAVAEALDGFDANAQERILRWARERIGLSTSLPPAAPASLPSLQQPPNPPGTATQASSGKDLKSFVDDKKPKRDVQFAATVAYFHRFEAPPTERKNEIDSKDLQDACRLAGRKRLKLPGQTLRDKKSQQSPPRNLRLSSCSARGSFWGRPTRRPRMLGPESIESFEGTWRKYLYFCEVTPIGKTTKRDTKSASH